MNRTVELLQTHTSVRRFEATPLTSAVKAQLLTAAHGGSSSNFVQATTIIEVTDPAIRAELATISQSAAYVKQSGAFYMFVADLYRQATVLTRAHQSLTPIQNVEALTVGIVDTAIAGENMAVAAEAMGLGICFIGGIRNDLFRVRDLLGLPQYTVPLFGLTVGVPVSKNAIKPRMPQANTVFTNRYDAVAATDLTAYDQTMATYYANRGTHAQVTDWSTKMRTFFATPRRPDVATFMVSQGFTLS